MDGVVSIPQIESYDLNGVSQNLIGEVNDDLSLGIYTDMPHLPAVVSDEAGAGPQLDGLSNRFNLFRLADLAGSHLGMDTHDQKREKSTDSSIAWLVGITRTLTCLSRAKRRPTMMHAPK
ncbi:MAG: hypothetical protein ACLPH3_12190 [Terracidiphilus sp.]